MYLPAPCRALRGHVLSRCSEVIRDHPKNPSILLALVQHARIGRALGVLSIALLSACGGGGGNSGAATNNSGSGGSVTQALPKTWTLESATPAQVELNQTDGTAVLDHIFSDQAIQSATLVKDGYIVGQRFATGLDETTLGTSWSVAKSFYSAAIGAAIDEGWINGVEQCASDFLVEWLGTEKEEITIGDLLEMRGGFEPDSSIFFENDQTAFALSFPLNGTPGSTFWYSNPSSQLFEPLLLRATGLNAHSYLRQSILEPIGIDTTRVGMWLDPTGTNPLTYMGLDMIPSDLARFGLLFARGGEWDGTQVLSSDYVLASLNPRSAFYGYQWWVLNDVYFGQSTPITLSAALGLDGQKIYVWSEEDIVLVVQTLYEHAANQGYTLSSINWPNTCRARNTCPASTGEESDGGEVPPYNEYELMSLLAKLSE